MKKKSFPQNFKKRLNTPLFIYGVYTILALLIMGPMLKPGFILTLDMVFTPKISGPAGITNSYLWQELLHLLNLLIPGQIIEKIIIFVILITTGIGMHRLIETKSAWPKYFAGIFYVINPFTYERWLAGQYLVLFGYALLPFIVRRLFLFTAKPSKKQAGVLATMIGLVAILDIHMFVLAIIISVTIILLTLFRMRASKVERQNLLTSTGIFLLLLFIFNSYWLNGIIQGTSQISQTLHYITSNDISAFSTAASPTFGLLFNVESMYGIWLEPLHSFIMPNNNVLLWVLLYFCILALTIFGIKSRWQKSRQQTLSIAFIGLIGFGMALGIHAPLIGPINNFILTSVPFMRGFREPEKFTALLVFAYCFFSAYGAEYFMKYVKYHYPTYQPYVPIAVIILPLLYVPTMLFGFYGQLKPVEYPQSWQTANSRLISHPAQGKILFLPWHLYMSYDFAPRIIANPAQDFFYTSKVLSGTNAEFGSVFQAMPNPTSNFIVNQIVKKSSSTYLGAQLAKINVQYVFLVDGYDAKNYSFLNHQRDLIKVSNQKSLIIYKNTAYHHKP